MPPLGAKIFEGTPQSEDELALLVRANVLKKELYHRMGGIPVSTKKSKGDYLESAKAIYPSEEQPEAERTRAWVKRGLGSHPTLCIVTDRAVVTGSGIVPVPHSEIRHFGLESYGLMSTDHYLKFNAEQLVELLEAAGDTLTLIEQAAIIN